MSQRVSWRDSSILKILYLLGIDLDLSPLVVELASVVISLEPLKLGGSVFVGFDGGFINDSQLNLEILIFDFMLAITYDHFWCI